MVSSVGDQSGEVSAIASLEELFDKDFVERREQLWAACSIVVGMHPGQQYMHACLIDYAVVVFRPSN